MKTEKKRLSEEALGVLEKFSFPGNVRQLENLCNYLTVMAPSQLIRVEDLPEEVRGEKVPTETKAPSQTWEALLREATQKALSSKTPDVMEAFTKDFERVLYEEALKATSGKRLLAAKALGVGRNTLTRKLKELGIDDANA